MKDQGIAGKKVWRVIDVVNWAEEYFRSKNFESPRAEIEWLLRDILNCSRVDIYLRFEEPLSADQLDVLRAGVKRRLNREPLQYITGKSEFYGLTFKVTPDVLIPRPETERLVDTAIHSLRPQDSSLILDVGTGSGCVAIVLAKEFKSSKIYAIDVTDEAIAVAKENAELNGVTNIEFLRQDFLQDFSLPEKMDMIVSNPPYVTMEELTETMEDVREFEPHIALTDGSDGMTFYKRLAEYSPRILKEKGDVIFEAGMGTQPRRAADLFNDPWYKGTEIIQDYNGDDRVIHVQYSGTDDE